MLSSNFCWSPPSALICPGLQRTMMKLKALHEAVGKAVLLAISVCLFFWGGLNISEQNGGKKEGEGEGTIHIRNTGNERRLGETREGYSEKTNYRREAERLPRRLERDWNTTRRRWGRGGTYDSPNTGYCMSIALGRKGKGERIVISKKMEMQVQSGTTLTSQIIERLEDCYRKRWRNRGTIGRLRENYGEG